MVCTKYIIVNKYGSFSKLKRSQPVYEKGAKVSILTGKIPYVYQQIGTYCSFDPGVTIV